MISGKITKSIDTNVARNRRNAKKAIQLIFKKYGSDYLRFMKEYPPQRNPETKYVRGNPLQGSEDLGARWNMRMLSRSDIVVLSIRNNTSYVEWVQDRDFQADVHREWWQTYQDANELFTPLIESKLTSVIPNAVLQQTTRRRS